ncbi:M24 family metallopeptidase [Natronorubrum halophilum]|uniref:M24 family metallopeptidase n=1 Tax=Natronorubrum halophilum TaxID=1702106 RepID=UPI000EF6740C|nr:M24 family metallopeptidase [Natronorubrum halophilum]
MTGVDAGSDDGVGSPLESLVRETLEARDAVAFVHAGGRDDPAVRYCWATLERGAVPEHGVVAVGFDGEEWMTHTSRDASAHPARTLGSQLAGRVETATLLTPPRIPHDAALYLENDGFALASTDVIERARATKTPAERDRISTAQAAAGAGIRQAASLLANAAIDDGRLVVDGEELTPGRLRISIDEAVVSAGAFPAGNTVINPDPGHAPSSLSDGGTALRPGEPIVLETAPRGPGGYYGGLVRTLVVDGDGGRERRAHVGVTQSFQSARAMLTADTESVTRIEADLEAEVRAFGFGEADEVETRVAGVGLEPRERPLEGGTEVEPGSVVQLESAVRVDDDGGWLRIADILVKGETGERPEVLPAPSRSLEPTAVLEE